MARALQIAALTLPLLLAACAAPPRPRPQAAARTENLSTPSLSPRAPASDPRYLLVAGATAMLGQPYRWGGASPGGFDCSGLVAYAAAATGLHVPRTAEEQLHTGAAVSRRDVRTGDLVFMHLKRKELHVGIAIDNDNFIHAPAAGGRVRIDSLSAPVYARGFLTARRILGEGTSRTATAVQ